MTHSNKVYKKYLVYLFSVVLFLGLWINYSTNFLKIADMEWFQSWQLDSEALIWERIEDLRNYGLWYKAGLLGDYTAQLGLGGTVYGLINLILYPVFSNSILHFINTFILCLVLFYILKWIYREFGIVTATV